MIAYGRKKIRANYPDNYPRRPYYNWWEVEFNFVNKKAERQKAKKKLIVICGTIGFLN